MRLAASLSAAKVAAKSALKDPILNLNTSKSAKNAINKQIFGKTSEKSALLGPKQKETDSQPILKGIAESKLITARSKKGSIVLPPLKEESSGALKMKEKSQKTLKLTTTRDRIIANTKHGNQLKDAVSPTYVSYLDEILPLSPLGMQKDQ